MKISQVFGRPEGLLLVAALQGTSHKLKGYDARSGQQGSRSALCNRADQASQ